MNEDIVDTHLYVEALKEQRNQANDRAAVAIARATGFKIENTELRERVAELEARLAKLEQEPVCPD